MYLETGSKASFTAAKEECIQVHREIDQRLMFNCSISADHNHSQGSNILALSELHLYQ